MQKKNIQLYKFTPILKEIIWGGANISKLKGISSNKVIGESWEVSSINNCESIVCNGEDRGLTLSGIVDKHKSALVGRKCYEEFGSQFPLLLKFIDAHNDLSIQVHPNDELSANLENKKGKTEMWYVVSCDENTELIAGLKQETTQEQFCEAISKKNILPLLKTYKIQKADAFFIPAGTIHSINKGTMIAEIQQSSDVTYRLYDYDRKDSQGNLRELNVEKGIKAIDFLSNFQPKIEYKEVVGQTVEIVNSELFTVSIISMDNPVIKDYTKLDSFVVYMCVEGDCEILDSQNNREKLTTLESVMLSAQTGVVKITPKGHCKLLEVHVV